MAATVAQLKAVISVEGAEKAKSEIKSVGEQTQKTSHSFDLLKNAVSFAGGMALFQGLGFLSDQLGGVFTESMNAQEGMAQTNKVLQSTHDASGMTATAVADLAGNLSHLTKFSDDTTQAAENMLLTFTNIGKKDGIFEQATKTTLDMSQALGQDTKNSAIQLGKALNDPITGVSALQRVGVTFDATQKGLIKTYMAHNDVAKAQGIILKELQKEFGGSAEAAGKTFGGQMAILNQRLDDVRQNIGDALLPIVTQFAGYISTQFMPRLNDFSDWFNKEAIPAIQQFGKWFETDGIKYLTQFAQQLYTVALDGIHFVQWLHDGTPPAQALTDAAIALGIAIAAIKIGNLVSDMASFIGSVPEMVAKMFLVQEGAEGIAGAKGLGAVASEAGNAEKAMATAASGMKLSLVGILGAVGGVAGIEILLAKWIRDNDIIPSVKEFQHGQDSNPQWINHIDKAKIAAQEAAQQAKDLADQLDRAWSDMARLADYASSHQRILGDITDPIALTKDDVKLQQIHSHLDDIAKPYEPKIITADIEKGRLKVIEFKSRIDDVKGPVNVGVLTPQVEAARAKVIDVKSHIDDLRGPVSIGVLTGDVQAARARVIDLKSHIDDLSSPVSIPGPYVGGHAAGILNNPVGHWAMVGERGPEPMYVPQGASILPSGMNPGGASPQIIVQPPDIYLDGVRLSRGLMPHIAAAIRYNTGGFGR